MNHAISTHLFSNHRLTTAWLERIQHAGVPAVEIFCARQHLDYTNRAQVAELRHWFKDSELKLHSVHAPLYTDDVWGRSGPHSVITITEPVKSHRIEMVDEIKRAIELSESVPFRYLVQHIGVGGEEYSDRKFEAAFSSLDELSVFARQRGVEILLENIPNGFSTSGRLIQLLAETHLPLGFCFDVGHAQIEGSVESAFELMKDRIRSTHVHDNDGVDDKHLFPLLAPGGAVDWKGVMSLFRSRGDQFPLLLELKETPDFKHPIESCAEIFDRLENL
jgi:sugar phosphate isomerase/epimerase